MRPRKHDDHGSNRGTQIWPHLTPPARSTLLLILLAVSGQTIAKTFGAIAVWNDARVTRKALSQLTDRELDDIGLIRGDIEDVAGAR